MRELRRKLPKRVPGPDLLLPAGRHRHPDPQLRPAGADRRPGRRAATSEANYADRPADLSADRAGARRGGRAPPPGGEPPGRSRRRRPHQGAARSGLTQRDVANNLLISLSSSGQVAPTLAEPGERRQLSGRRADAAVPDRLASTTWRARRSPAPGGGRTAAAREPGHVQPRQSRPPLVSHYNVQPVFDVYASVQERDLGAVATDIDRIVARSRRSLPRGLASTCAGRSRAWRRRSTRLGLGLVFAVVLVYLLMVVNFQSWLDPFIILMALPGALAGIVWMLFVTRPRSACPR